MASTHHAIVFKPRRVLRHERITGTNRLDHGQQARKQDMDRCEHRECEHYPDPQDRQKPRWIDARRLFAEKLEKLRLEEEAGREGDGQGCTHDEVEGAKDSKEDS